MDSDDVICDHAKDCRAKYCGGKSPHRPRPEEDAPFPCKYANGVVVQAIKCYIRNPEWRD